METKYWIIGTNKWNKEDYTEEQAIELSKTLINCENCVDCGDCRDCSDCYYCMGCKNCKKCDFCYWLLDGYNESCYGVLF